MTSNAKHHPFYQTHSWLNWVANRLLFSSASSKWIERALLACLSFTGIFLTFLQFCDNSEQHFPKWARELVDELYARRLLFCVVMLTVQVFCTACLGLIRFIHPIDLEKAKVILEQAVANHFLEADRVKFVYRATLFKIRGFRWPFGQWLGIICRSGETFDQSNTIFSICRMIEKHNTGLAGKCFFARGATLIPPEALNPADRQAYLDECGLDQNELAKINVPSTVIFVTGIKRRGKMWGVLVLDSSDPTQVPAKSAQTRTGAPRHQDDIETSALFLGLLVE